MDFKRMLWMVVGMCLSVQFTAVGQATPDREVDANGYITQLTLNAEKLLFAQPDSAFIEASKALQLSDQNGYALGSGNSHQLIGTVFYHQGVYLQSLDHLLKAEEIF